MEMHRNRKTKHDTDNNKTKRIKVKRLQIESKTAVFIKPHPKWSDINDIKVKGNKSTWKIKANEKHQWKYWYQIKGNLRPNKALHRTNRTILYYKGYMVLNTSITVKSLFVDQNSIEIQTRYMSLEIQGYIFLHSVGDFATVCSSTNHIDKKLNKDNISRNTYKIKKWICSSNYASHKPNTAS